MRCLKRQTLLRSANDRKKCKSEDGRAEAGVTGSDHFGVAGVNAEIIGSHALAYAYLTSNRYHKSGVVTVEFTSHKVVINGRRVKALRLVPARNFAWHIGVMERRRLNAVKNRA